MKKQEEEEEKELAFRENSPYLYDMLIVDKSLESTSHTVQWLPLRTECEDDRFTTEYFLMGTHNEAAEDQDEEVTNSIMICSVNIPKLDKGVSFNKKDENLMENLSKLKIVKSIDHPQDVSKARAMIGNPNNVVSFTNEGDINIYDFNELKHTFSLVEHTKYGFGLCWKSESENLQSNILVSSGTDSKIAVWDINKLPLKGNIITPLNTLTYHSKSVNCVDINPSNNEVFASVSDDSNLSFWDMRDLSKPIQWIQASKDGLNAICFWLHDNNTFLTGGQESGEIHLWDIRKLTPMVPLSWLIGHNMAVTNITFSPLNKNIFCSGSQIPDEPPEENKSNYGVIIWDILKIGEETSYNADEEWTLSPCLILSHDGHESTVDDIAWSPYDRHTLSTVDGNKSINFFQISEELFMSPIHYENEFDDLQDWIVE